MKRLLAIVVALAPATLSAQSLDGWEKTRWGMTASEVLDILGSAAKPSEVAGPPLILTVDSVAIGEREFVATLMFSGPDPRLSFVALSPARGADSMKELHDAVFDDLVATHGKPAIDRRAAWDRIEARQSIWSLGSTTIDLELLTGTEIGQWMFSYRPARREAQGGEGTRYLAPSAFKGIPARLKESLEKLGCRVPQPWSDRGPQNVVSGRFLTRKERSWAVLCSRAGASAILVFSEGDAEIRAALNPALDSNFGTPGGDYERGISVASPAFILRHDKLYGNDPPLPKLDHDGIDDATIGKGSGIHYFDGKGWRSLAGAD